MAVFEQSAAPRFNRRADTGRFGLPTFVLCVKVEQFKHELSISVGERPAPPGGESKVVHVKFRRKPRSV